MEAHAVKQTPAARDSSLATTARRARSEAATLIDSIEEIGGEIDSMVQHNLAERPYVTLLGAAGVGFVVGGGLSPRFLRFSIGLGGRLAVAMMARRLTDPQHGEKVKR